ncbi:MAG: hypothetical protein NC241_08720 [Bacteroides sp.]|nr:hypothetical protein [Bacteroides sp.]
MTEQSDYIVYALTDDRLFSAFVEDNLEEFAKILHSGKFKKICKNQFDCRKEAEAFGRNLAYSLNGIPLFAYDDESTPYAKLADQYAL